MRKIGFRMLKSIKLLNSFCPFYKRSTLVGQYFKLRYENIRVDLVSVYKINLLFVLKSLKCVVTSKQLFLSGKLLYSSNFNFILLQFIGILNSWCWPQRNIVHVLPILASKPTWIPILSLTLCFEKCGVFSNHRYNKTILELLEKNKSNEQKEL